MPMTKMIAGTPNPKQCEDDSHNQECSDCTTLGKTLREWSPNEMF